MARGHSKTNLEHTIKSYKWLMARLLTSVSYAAITILSMHYAEEDQRKSEAFMSFVEARRKHTLRITFRGKPFLPVFHAGHYIKPDNWIEVPLVQS